MLTYTASGTDCAIPGIWRAQAHVVLASGEPLRTDPDAITWRVKANLPGA